MFKIKELTLQHKNDFQKYTFDEINYYYGANAVGKTLLIKTIDFMLGKSENILLSNIGLQEIDCCTLKVAGTNILELKRDKKDCYYRYENDIFKKITLGEYIKLISKEIEIKFQYYQSSYNHITGEEISHRVFSWLNMIEENGIGFIAPPFLKILENKHRYRIMNLFEFLFNSKNINNLKEIEKQIDFLKEERKHLEKNYIKYNIVIDQLKNEFQNLSLEFSDKFDENYEIFYKYKEQKKRADNLGKSKDERDLSYLIKIEHYLSEEIKRNVEMEIQMKNINYNNVNEFNLVKQFENFLTEHTDYSKYIKQIKSCLEQNYNNQLLLGLKDYKKTNTTIKEKQLQIQGDIKKIESKLNKSSLEKTNTSIVFIEKLFYETNLISYNKEKLEEINSKIKTLNKNYNDIKKKIDTSLQDEVEVQINKYYKELKDICFVKSDIKENNFEIKFNYKIPILFGKKTIKKNEILETVDYDPGSKARKTIWQVLLYISMLQSIKSTLKHTPIPSLLMIDALDQPFDEESNNNNTNYDAFTKFIMNKCKDLNIQLIITSTTKLKNTNIDIQYSKYEEIYGFNKWYEKYK